MSILSRLVDERFLSYRRRSTMLGGQVGAVLAFGLFFYRHYVNHVWSWDLLVIGATISGVKLAAMAWYLLSE